MKTFMSYASSALSAFVAQQDKILLAINDISANIVWHDISDKQNEVFSWQKTMAK